ncbi:MAG TPA: type II secretion system protein [Candidatus Limnocylindria bacterium]|nr:type II secretion system protein [Candidatus Limnocylindria bacterium]
MKPRPQQRPHDPPAVSRAAFTLIELLTVIAIIGVLATLLASTLASAKIRAQQSTCFNNLHQIALAVEIYTDDAGRRPRSMTRLTLRPALLGSANTLLCPSDPALRRPRTSKGQTNQAWGNLANASQEPGNDLNLKDPEAGSWQAEIAEKEERVQFSYLHPLGWAKAAWLKLIAQGNQAGIAVCQLHGVRTASDHNPFDHQPYEDYEGRTLRVQRDGAVVVRKIFRGPAVPPSGSPAKPEDYPWDFYTDNPPSRP